MKCKKCPCQCQTVHSPVGIDSLVGCVLNGTVCVTGLPVFSGGPP